ncbi:MAG: PAS domain S-box protein [Methylocystis sp.]
MQRGAMPKRNASTLTFVERGNEPTPADAIIAGVMDAIIAVDDRQRIVLFNPAAERLFKCTAAEAIGGSLDRFIPPRFREAHRKHVEDFYETGLTNRRMGDLGALKALRADGEEFFIEAAIARIDVAGEKLLAVSIRDVTARERAEALLRESEERYRAVVQHVVDGVITIDQHGIMQSVNVAAERLFGYSAAELRGKNVALLMPEPYQSQHDGYIASYRETGQAKIIGIGREVFGRRKNGSVFPIDLAISEFRLGEARYFTGLVRDISERKEVEARLEFYAEALTRQNAELASSNQELDDFAYIASHDLKEPLRGIHNYAGFLIEDHGDRLGDDGRAKLETVKRLAQRLEGLINSLLTFSRVGRVELAVQETDLNQILAEVLDSLAITLKEKGVEVRIPKRLASLRCDQVRIAEVFRNLITNAIKYNDKPTKWIEIGGCAEGEPRGSGKFRPGEAAFYVRDNGIGIQEKHLEAVFQIFKRLHSRDRYGEGTGAGLTIVKKIVERHGGRIWVDSKTGEGSTFYFTLACKDQTP